MPKSLSVHKNTLEKRIAKQTRSEMVSAAQRVGSHDIVAYAIVGISSDGTAHAAWDTGACMPMWGFPHAVAEVLVQDMHGVDEDWKPSLQERRGLKPTNSR